MTPTGTWAPPPRRTGPPPLRDETAERGLAGAILADPTLISEVSAQVNADDISPGKSREVFRAVVELHQAGRLPAEDQARRNAVAAHLKAGGRLKVPPAPVDLTRWTAAGRAMRGRLPEVIAWVLDCAARRRWRELGETVAGIGDLDPADQPAEADRLLHRLAALTNRLDQPASS